LTSEIVSSTELGVWGAMERKTPLRTGRFQTY
jgi:hypothetical protein